MSEKMREIISDLELEQVTGGARSGNTGQPVVRTGERDCPYCNKTTTHEYHTANRVKCTRCQKVYTV